MLGHPSLPSALRGDLLDPASPTGQAEQPRSPLRYVSCAAGVGADRSARSCKWAVPGDLPGVVAEDSGEPLNAAAAPGRRRYKPPARLKRRNVRHPRSRRVERPGGLRRYAIFYVFLPISQRRTRTGGDPVNSSTPGIHNFLDQIHSSPSLTTQAIRSAEGEPKMGAKPWEIDSETRNH